MFLVFGSHLDDHPRSLVECWRQNNVTCEIVTPVDLSRAGWRFKTGADVDLQAALLGGRIAGADIRGVVNLLPWITVHDLPHIDEDDRAYVANEMAAFLLAWLSALECPMVERPSTLSLAGCGRWPSEWEEIAKRVHVEMDMNASGPMLELTVLQGEVVGRSEFDPELVRAAEAIARESRRLFITFYFNENGNVLVLTGVASRPAAGSLNVAKALLNWFNPK